MSYAPSLISRILQPICRQQFSRSVARHQGDRYGKSFSSWDHLVALITSQLSGADSLRALEMAWRVQPHCHYHVGPRAIPRSTLSDANRRRPAAIFAETFTHLARRAHRKFRQEGEALVELIDSSPIPLTRACLERSWNGRIKGAKLHLAYAVREDVPLKADITSANVNDVCFTHDFDVTEDTTYVFDKGYYALNWFRKIHETNALFITRLRKIASFETVEARRVEGDGILSDETVRHSSRSTSRQRLDFPLRLIKLITPEGRKLTLITNDLDRSASQIAALYKSRWQIELLFRWLKQNLKIKRFIGNNLNAVKLQILAALIAYLLIRLAENRQKADPWPTLRFIERIRTGLFTNIPLDTLTLIPKRRTPIAKRPDQICLL